MATAAIHYLRKSTKTPCPLFGRCIGNRLPWNRFQRLNFRRFPEPAYGQKNNPFGKHDTAPKSREIFLDFFTKMIFHENYRATSSWQLTLSWASQLQKNQNRNP